MQTKSKLIYFLLYQKIKYYFHSYTKEKIKGVIRKDSKFRTNYTTSVLYGQKSQRTW